MAGNEDFSINFVIGSTPMEHMHQDIEFVFVIDGIIKVSILEKSFVLKSEDMLVINSNYRHSWVEMESAHVCVIHLNYGMLSAYKEHSMLVFNCNTVAYSNANYDYLRVIVGNLLSECAVDMEKMTFMKKSWLYNLVNCLVEYFLFGNNEIKMDDDTRVERILEYINANYAKTLTLKEMAELTYMVPASFSRYFRKRVGMTFIKYVNAVRLHFALEDICYTEKNIVWIAQNHGFSSSTLFARVFKEAYGMSPLAYRQQFKNKPQEIGAKKLPSDRNFLKKYIRHKDNYSRQILPIKRLEIHEDMDKFNAFSNPWSDAVNLGNVSQLLSAKLQKQIVFLHDEINFTYGLIYGVFSDALQLRPGHMADIINFGALDTVFDFCVENRIRPIVCFGNNPTVIRKTVNENILTMDAENIFESIDECLGVMEAFVTHIIARYGIPEVEQWMFECWYNEYLKNTMGIPGSFVKVFTEIVCCIRKYLNRALVGGCGMAAGIGAEKFRKLILDWKCEPVWPDFVSTYLFPYERADIDGRLHSKRRVNNRYFLDELNRCRSIMDELNWNKIPIYVLEWNLSLSHRNYFNDTCGKAALMINQMSQLMNKVSFAAYYEVSDFSSVYNDSGRMLLGGVGLMCCDGVPKPSLYALKFMGMLERCLVAALDNYILTTNGKSDYTILCCNHKQLKYNYYVKDESSTDLGDISGIFEDNDPLELAFNLDNVQSGTYVLREYGIHPGRGSVLEAWIELGLHEPLALDDIKYLKNICIPYQKNIHIKTSGNRLVFIETLRSHEIKLIKISKL